MKQYRKKRWQKRESYRRWQENRIRAAATHMQAMSAVNPLDDIPYLCEFLEKIGEQYNYPLLNLTEA